MPYTNSETTAAATIEATDPFPSCGNGSRAKSVWYAFTAPAAGAIVADTFGSSYNTILAAYTGTCGNVTEVGCNDDSASPQSQVVLTAAAGTTYSFMVTAFNNDGGNLVFDLRFQAAPPTTTPTFTATPTPTSTSTAPVSTSTPTPTATSPPYGVSGTIRYYSNAAPVGAATVQLQGSITATVQTDVSGQYAFPAIGTGNWQIQPSKIGDAQAGISTLDAVYILQAIAGTRTLTPEQRLACDVTGNGTLSTLDAVRILQLKVGSITSFEVAQACGSDWAFIPVPAATPNQLVIAPQMTTGSCQAGAIAWQPLVAQADNQDFSAVLFGDCTGNWQPGVATAVARRLTVAPVRIGRPLRRGTRIHVPLIVAESHRFSGLDVEVAYDPTHLTFRRVHRVGSASPALLAAHEQQPGLVAVSLASGESLPAGTVAALLFEDRERRSESWAIHVVNAEATNE